MLDMILIRLASVLFVVVLLVILPGHQFKIVFLSLLFSHYFLSFFYAKKQIKTLFSTFKFIVPLSILLIASTFYLTSGIYALAFIPFIALHVAISETYMINENLSSNLMTDTPNIKHLNASRFLLNFFLILTLMRNLPVINSLPLAFVYTALVISIFYFLFSIHNMKKYLNSQLLKTIFTYELTGVTLAGILFLMNIPMAQQYFVLYHVATWIFFSFMKPIRNNNRTQLNNLGIMVFGSTLFFFLLVTPIVNQAPLIALDLYVPLWASIHFLATFAMSRLNPQMIRQIFYN